MIQLPLKVLRVLHVHKNTYMQIWACVCVCASYLCAASKKRSLCPQLALAVSLPAALGGNATATLSLWWTCLTLRSMGHAQTKGRNEG